MEENEELLRLEYKLASKSYSKNVGAEASDLALYDTWFASALVGARADFLVAPHVDAFDSAFARIGELAVSSASFEMSSGWGPAQEAKALRAQVWFGGRAGDKVWVGRPVLYENEQSRDAAQAQYLLPSLARLLGKTYAASVHFDVEYELTLLDEERKEERVLSGTLPRKFLGKFPVMLGSEQCVLRGLSEGLRAGLGEAEGGGAGLGAGGGFFVVGGKEKVVVLREREEEVGGWRLRPGSDHAIELELAASKRRVPLFVAFRALGAFMSDRAIVEVCSLRGGGGARAGESGCGFEFERLRGCVYAAAEVRTQKQAVRAISAGDDKNSAEQSWEEFQRAFALQSERDSPVPPPAPLSASLLLARRVQLFLSGGGGGKGGGGGDEATKKIDTCGSLLGGLFSEGARRMKERVEAALREEYLQSRARSTQYLGKGLVELFAQFLDREVVREREAESLVAAFFATHEAVEDLDRRSPLATLHHLRKVIIKSAPQFGYVDFLQPDQLALGVHLSVGLAPRQEQGLVAWLCSGVSATTRVFDFNNNNNIKKLRLAQFLVNGKLVGLLEHPLEFRYMLLLHRRNGLLPADTSLYFDFKHKELHVWTDAGRACRPLFFMDRHGTPSFVRAKGQLLFSHSRGQKARPKATAKARAKAKAKAKANGDHDNHDHDDDDDTHDHDYNDFYTFDQAVFGFFDDEERKGAAQPSMAKPTWASLEARYEAWLTPKHDGAARHKSLHEPLEKYQCLVDFVDANEQRFALVAPNTQALTTASVYARHYTHLEIHPRLVLGAPADSLLAFPNHMCARASSRALALMTSCALPASSSARAPGLAHAFAATDYAQRPLVLPPSGGGGEGGGGGPPPLGLNLVVAVLGGFGAAGPCGVALNRGSVERGLFDASVFATYVFGESGKRRLKGVVGARVALDRGTKVFESADPKHDVYSSWAKRGVVDSRFVSGNAPGRRVAHVSVRRKVKLGAGGLLACRHLGQQSAVCELVDEAALPFTRGGLRPDIVVSVAQASADGVSFLLECLYGKAGAVKGGAVDACAFMDNTNNPFRETFARSGLSDTGEEIMYCGETGAQLSAAVFVGSATFARCFERGWGEGGGGGGELEGEEGVGEDELDWEQSAGALGLGASALSVGFCAGDMDCDQLAKMGVRVQLLREEDANQQRNMAFSPNLCRLLGVETEAEAAIALKEVVGGAGGDVAGGEANFAQNWERLGDESEYEVLLTDVVELKDEGGEKGVLKLSDDDDDDDNNIDFKNKNNNLMPEISLSISNEGNGGGEGGGSLTMNIRPSSHLASSEPASGSGLPSAELAFAQEKKKMSVFEVVEVGGTGTGTGTVPDTDDANEGSGGGNLLPGKKIVNFS